MAYPVVKYNSYEFPRVHGPYSFTHTATEFKFSCSFLLVGSTSSALITEEATMLAAVKVIKAPFYLSFNDKKEFELTHEVTGGTGFNTQATVTKTTNKELSTPLSREYSLSVSMGLPYTQDNGRITANVSIAYSPSTQATASFSMTYSASTTNNALTVYKADTWVTTMLTAIFTGGEVMEKISSSWTQDHNQKSITAREIYKQVMFPASTDSSIESKIVNASLNFSVAYMAEVNALISSADQKENLPMLELNLGYQCTFDKSKLTSPNDMTSIWRTNLRGRLLSQASSILTLSGYSAYTSPTFFIKNENVSANPSAYSLTASMTVGCRSSGTHIFALNESIQITRDEGIVYDKLWDGEPNTFVVYTTGRVMTLNRSVQMAQFMVSPTVPEMPKNYLLASGSWIRLRNSEHESMQSYGFKYSGAGSDNGSAEKVPLYKKNVSENYICIDTAKSVNTVIGSVGSKTNTSMGGL